jgi:glycosyltransferase involved in cell wall biosynthesis
VRLLYTITAYPPSIGGAQAHFHQLARRLVKNHRLEVVTHWSETRTDWLLGTTLRAPRRPTSYQIDRVPVHLVTLTSGERFKVSPLVAGYHLVQGPAIDRISDLLAEHLEPFAEQIDLVHNGRIGREGLSFASLKLARRRGVPFVLTPFHHPRWEHRFYQRYLNLYREADGVIALTEGEKEALVRLGVEPERVFVTGMGPILAPTVNGVSFRQAFDIDGPMVLFLGQKYRYKGLSALLEAAPAVWARFPDARFVFIGPRTRYSRLRLSGCDDRRVLEMGTVDLETKTNALAACDLLCLPSTQESFGGVFLEAWMMGKPVIGGDTPAVRVVIDDGVDGYVVRQDSGPIAERIIQLLEQPALRAQMGAAGRAKTQTHFTWERLVEKTEAAYQTVLR